MSSLTGKSMKKISDEWKRHLRLKRGTGLKWRQRLKQLPGPSRRLRIGSRRK